MGKLAYLLKWGFAGNMERSRLVNRPEFIHNVGGKESQTYKALLKAENTTDGAYLIQEEVYKTVVEGSEPAKCMREVLPVIKTDNYSLRVVSGEAGTYAEEIPEGASIPIDTQEYSKTTIEMKKVGVRPLITNELIEDGLFDLVEFELKKAGARCENKLNRDVILELLTNISGPSDVDPATDNYFKVSDIATAIENTKAYNFHPDKLVMNATAEGKLLGDSNLVYVSYAGTDSTLKTGRIPTLLGLKPYLCTVTTGSTAKYWDGTDAANHYMAMVLDTSTPVGIIGMRRDLTVDKYKDPINDLLGISVTMRYGVGVTQAAAGCRILTT